MTTLEPPTPTRQDVPRKVDRDEVFLEYTKSICPVCKAVVDGQVNIRDNKVYLRKRCRAHGTFEALVYGDAQMYVEATRFNKPGTIPLRFHTEVADGCPTDCGLCPEHKQHAPADAQMRGTDLRARKRHALDNCAEAGLTVTLAAAVERGMNEAEVGAIVRFGVRHPAVRGSRSSRSLTPAGTWNSTRSSG